MNVNSEHLRLSNVYILAAATVIAAASAGVITLSSISVDTTDVASAYHGIRFTASVLFAGCGIWIGFMYPQMRAELDRGEVLTEPRKNLFRNLLEVLAFTSLILIGVLAYEVANTINGMFPVTSSTTEGLAVFGLVLFSILEACSLLFIILPVFNIWTKVREKSEENRSDRSM